MSPANPEPALSPARHPRNRRPAITSTVRGAVVRDAVTVELPLRHAGLHRLDVAYEYQGDSAAPLVLVAGGISANRHVASSDVYPEAGWWDAHVGRDRALDPGRHCILAIDWLGADGALDVPIDTVDQAAAIAAVLDMLGVRRAAAFIGCSYGAMVALQFAAVHGERVERVVAISGCDRPHPYTSAARALQRRAVALGALQCDESAGLALARAMAMLLYRTPDDFARRFSGPPAISHGRLRCAAEDYLDHCGQRFVERLSPTAFLRLSESLDLHDVAADAIGVPVFLLAVAGDRLIPIADAHRLAAQLGGPATLRVVDSPYGHDAFLKAFDPVDRLLREALDVSHGGAW